MVEVKVNCICRTILKPDFIVLCFGIIKVVHLIGMEKNIFIDVNFGGGWGMGNRKHL